MSYKLSNPWIATFASLLFFISPQAFATDNHASPHVVVSIKPLHSIVAGVMQGVSTPHLIVKGNASPHTYRLKPSDASALQDADAVFWAGDNVEPFLIKPLSSLTRNARVVSLSKTPGIRLLEIRGGERWQSDHDHGHGGHMEHGEQHDEHADPNKHEQHKEEHAHQEKHKDHADHETHEEHHVEHMHDEEHDGHHDDHAKHKAHEGVLDNIDPHVWLDPLNTRIMLKKIVHILSEIDPQHASKYQQNGNKLDQRLERLHLTLASELKPVTGLPYMVFHDGYQYLEKRYHLNAVGSIVFQADEISSAKRLREMHKLIEDSQVKCVFSEPEFSTKKIDALIRGTTIKTASLDPVGADVAPGPDLYFTVMTRLGQSIRDCLQD